MAVTTVFTLETIEALDPSFIIENADATSLAGGGVLVAGDHVNHVDLTIYDASGNAVGSALSIAGLAPSASQLSNGNVVIATDAGATASFRIVAPTGGAIVADTALTAFGSDQLNVDVTGGLAGGRFAIVYQAAYTQPDNDIRVVICNNDGTVVTQFGIDTSTADDQAPSVAALADGAFAVAWQRNVGGESELWYAVYEANGTVRKAAALHDSVGTINKAPTVVALGSGFAVVYEDNGWSVSDTDITFARFSSAGFLTSDDDVSLTTTNESQAAVTVLSNGMVLIGSIGTSGATPDPRWTLVNQTTGDILATSSAGATANTDAGPTIAAMALGQAATFFSNNGSDVVGTSLQGVRTATGDAANDTITGDDLRDVLSGGGGNDAISGEANNDTLSGGAGNDTLGGGNGNDRLDGGTGFDSLTGGDGDDTYIIDNTADVASEAGTSGFDVVLSTVSWTLGTDFENLTLGGTAAINGAGNAGNNRILGNANNNILVGGGGDDQLIGGGGSDDMRGSSGIDTVSYVGTVGAVQVDLSILVAQNTGGGGVDTITTVENLFGTAQGDTLSGDNRNNVLRGEDGNDTLNGRDGKDELVGGTGNDNLSGGADIDTLNGGAGNDSLNGGSEADRLFGEAGVDQLFGETGNDTLDGGADDDDLIGGAGNDILRGGLGNDQMIGDVGRDNLTGGAGNDEFQFNTLADSTVASTGRDTIADFVRVDGDKIDLSVIDAINGGADNPFSFSSAQFFDGVAGRLIAINTGANSIVQGDTDGDGDADFAILVAGVNDMIAADFLL